MRHERRFSTLLSGLFAFLVTISVASLSAQQSPEAPPPDDQQIGGEPDRDRTEHRQAAGFVAIAVRLRSQDHSYAGKLITPEIA